MPFWFLQKMTEFCIGTELWLVHFGSGHVGSVSLEQGCPASSTTSTRNLSKSGAAAALVSREDALLRNPSAVLVLKIKFKKLKSLR